MFTTIYTHKPPHHFDEVCAIPALMLAKNLQFDEVKIVELSPRDALKKILKDNEYMIDTGGRDDGIRYFDHHHRNDNVSAFGIICDRFDQLKVFRKSTLRKYVDSLDTRGRNDTLEDMGVTGAWRDRFEVFPELTMATSKFDKGDRKGLIRVYEYLKWAIEWDRRSKELVSINTGYYRNNCDVITCGEHSVLKLTSINPQTGTTSGIKDIIKKHKAEFLMYPGKYDVDWVVVQCGKMPVSAALLSSLSNRHKLKYKLINSSLGQLYNEDRI